MNRLTTALLVGVIVIVGAANGQQLERLDVRGTLDVPPGTILPDKFRVEVEILKIEPGKVITFARQVGRLQTTTVKSLPYQFTVGCPKSVLKDTPPKMFIVRGSVYELPKAGGSKLIFQTPENDRIAAFTAEGAPLQDVRLNLKATAGK
jgi:hypothetical protein